VACVLEESAGVPLLVEETASRLQASGALRLTASGPLFDAGPYRADVDEPTGYLREHHRRRAASADDEALRALAVFGAPAAAATVAELCGMAEEDVEATLTGRAGDLISVSRLGGRRLYGYRSMLTRNMVRSSLPPARLPAYHRKAAAVAEGAGAIPGIDAEELVWRHLMLAGDRAGAWRRGLAHGRRLEEERRLENAGQVYEALIADGPPREVPADCAVELLWRSAALLRAAGRTDEARTQLELAESLAVAGGLSRLLTRVRLEQGYLLEKQGDLEQAAEIYRRERHGPSARDPVIRGEILFRLGTNAGWRERPEEAERCLEAYWQALRESGDDAATPAGLFLQCSIIRSRQRPDEAIDLIQGWLSTPEGQAADTVMAGRLNVQLGDMLYHQNRFAEADRLFARSMEIFTAHGEQGLAAITLANRGAMHFEQGRFSVAGRFNLDCLRAHERMGNRYGQARSQYNLGVCDFHRGRYAEAMEHLRASRGIHEYVGDVQGLAQSLNMEAELFLNLDLPQEAERRLLEAREVLPPGDTGYSAADRLLLEAEWLLRTGRQEEAAGCCEHAGELFRSLGDARQEARTAMLLSRTLAHRGRVADASSALDRARSMTVRLDSPRLHAELLLAASELRCRFGRGPTHTACSDRCRGLLDDLAELEDPDFLQSLWGALGRHLLALGRTEQAMSAWRQAFDLLRGVASRFGSAHRTWKSAYLSAPHREDVVRSLAEWSKKNVGSIQAGTDSYR
jgi:tetratricopeptide (TPR) repeat protein